MSYHFAIEQTCDGSLCIAVRGPDGAVLMTSSHFAADREPEALATFRGLLMRDWCYRIVNRRNTGLRFVLQLPHSGMTCLSRPFSSCDAMEVEIAQLKRAAATTFPFHEHDKDNSPSARGRGDDRESFAARLRRLA